MQRGLRQRMTTSRDIPLTPRESSEDSTHDRAAILNLDDADEHDQLLPSSPAYDETLEAESLLNDHIQYGTTTKPVRLMAFRIGLAVALVLIFISAAAAFAPRRQLSYDASATFYNGSTTYDATVIMISLDGFRADYLDRNNTPTLSRLGIMDGEEGCLSVTFPNHWSLVTGLYPESHGIVGNEFMDPQLNDTFFYKDPARSWDSKWWKGEPIWITSVLQNKRSAVLMWPGSNVKVNNVLSTYHIPYSGNYTASEKADVILNWLDMPRDERPQLMNIYIPQIDSVGHRQGPNGQGVTDMLADMDASIGHLVEGLQARNLYNHVHVVIVSDHGMAETNKNRLIFWDDIVSPDLLAQLEEREVWPLLAVRPKANAPLDTVDKIYAQFLNYTKQPDNTKDKSAPQSHFQVYLREDVPDKFHYSNNQRIAPIVAIPDVGWSFVTHKEFDGTKDYHPKGVHGYDNMAEEMRAIFIARGPMFDREYSTGEPVEPFLNTEVYGVVARALGLSPASNNGTLEGVLQQD
ncbi:hypothetical protein INT44_000257 [Umbelopsis vinacea]|uniref:Phosphodiest-domain-containing protein n=1 Tax=Umbelopsis vinacea TaxID=44442 RepID=A0A8H7UDT3_9FUNG|nr:hypothetical protein INT44_000257 [Umbelopsis vinacea]